MCEHAGIARGQRALDVGCGSGALLEALADTLGADNVSGIDPSDSFVDFARARVPGARVVVGSAESIPFDDGEFDATLSQLVVNFLADPEQGLREMTRVTRPGGLVAGCVWDYGGGMTMLKTFWDAAAALDSERATPLMEQHTMRFSTLDELASLWREAASRRGHGADRGGGVLRRLRRPLGAVPDGRRACRSLTPPRSTPTRRNGCEPSSAAASASPTARSRSRLGPCAVGAVGRVAGRA